MESGSELSKTATQLSGFCTTIVNHVSDVNGAPMSPYLDCQVATFIVQKLLLDDSAMSLTLAHACTIWQNMIVVLTTKLTCDHNGGDNVVDYL